MSLVLQIEVLDKPGLVVMLKCTVKPAVKALL